MKYFIDAITGQKMASDSYAFEVYNDVFYKFTYKYKVIKREVDDSLIGGNKSEELPGKITSVFEETVIDGVDDCKLGKTCNVASKKDAKRVIVVACGKLLKQIKKTKGVITREYKAKLAMVYKELVRNWASGNVSIYSTEDDVFDNNGFIMTIQVEDGTPYGYIPIDCLREEDH